MKVLARAVAARKRDLTTLGASAMQRQDCFSTVHAGTTHCRGVSCRRIPSALRGEPTSIFMRIIILSAMSIPQGLYAHTIRARVPLDVSVTRPVSLIWTATGMLAEERVGKRDETTQIWRIFQIPGRYLLAITPLV